ncbi:MAG: putative RNA-binding protein RbpA [Candidatus Doudnabacteria bacterium]|nr:putative RNA-binding protein RbpA [Candidatus Doudnabacteria bacterium]
MCERPIMAKLFVGGLPWATTSDELNQLFAQAGTVTSATVIQDRMTGRSKGFGFVEMSDEDSAKAIAMFNDTDYGGRKLVVNEARPMTPRPQRSFGDRGDRGGRGGRDNY